MSNWTPGLAQRARELLAHKQSLHPSGCYVTESLTLLAAALDELDRREAEIERLELEIEEWRDVSIP